MVSRLRGQHAAPPGHPARGPCGALVPPCIWEADSDEAICLVSTLIVGVLSQTMANEPDLEWGQGRFTPTFPKLMKLLVAAYPRPASGSTSGSDVR